MSDHPNAAADAAAEAASADEDAQAQADFDAGAAMEASTAKVAPAAQPTEPKPAGRPAGPSRATKAPDPKTTAGAPQAAAPDYVQVTREQFDRWNAAADRTATYEQQLSRAFGTIGDLQRLVRQLQGQTPRGLKVEIPKDAFADMAKDFPELAQLNQAALEKALQGITGSAPAETTRDPEEIRRTVAERIQEVQVEALEEEYPDWKTIVGSVATQKGERPDPTNPFRKWLTTKDAAYQARINGTNSAAVLAQAIRRYQRESTAAAAAPSTPRAAATAPDPRAQQRRNQIRAAIQPRGDGGQPQARNTEEDDFAAGFKTG